MGRELRKESMEFRGAVMEPRGGGMSLEEWCKYHRHGDKAAEE